ncbi:MAG: 30S ribosomal protein S13 [archaeon]|nr:30S ribosomal protein S13 [archaeon]
MAEKPQIPAPHKQTQPKPAQKVSKKPQEEQSNEILVRILGYDVPGSRNIYAGLTRIKGVSWAISNVICLKLNYPRTKKISELSKEDIKKIEAFLEDIPIPDFMKNRRLDLETGETKHLFGSDLDITREFDIKRMRKIKSYKGIRHALRLPVRGQRTKSHFRLNKMKSGGIKKHDKKA